MLNHILGIGENFYFLIFLAMIAIFLGDNTGLKIGKRLASRSLSYSWRSNNRSSSIRVSKTEPRAARRDQ
uniref:Uncharacterized protein n=1 Tax=Solanum tuberosum TaxID=4113 RepID=M1C028_SOLTU